MFKYAYRVTGWRQETTEKVPRHPLEPHVSQTESSVNVHTHKHTHEFSALILGFFKTVF